jgi:hypothetical protein
MSSNSHDDSTDQSWARAPLDPAGIAARRGHRVAARVGIAGLRAQPTTAGSRVQGCCSPPLVEELVALAASPFEAPPSGETGEKYRARLAGRPRTSTNRQPSGAEPAAGGHGLWTWQCVSGARGSRDGGWVWLEHMSRMDGRRLRKPPQEKTAFSVAGETAQERAD